MNYIRHLNSFFTLVKQDPNLTAAHVSLYMAMFQYWNFNRFKNPFPIQRDNMMQLSKIGSKNTYHKTLKDLHQAGYIFHHIQVSKFQNIKISMVRLDGNEQKNVANQLDIFSTKSDDLSCTEIDTDSVPNLTGMCPINDTVLVPNMGRYYIKQNNKHINSVQKTPTKIFNKNLNISNAINGFVRVANSVLEATKNVPLPFGEGSGVGPVPLPFGEGLGVGPGEGPGVRLLPSKQEVESFFHQNNYPSTEAAKFFYYNNGKAWMLTDKIPIKDWQSLAHKWMLNENPKNKSNE
ncbi:MAG: hypothetical protein ABIN36_16740, partial [Ferruginibacter sp.]